MLLLLLWIFHASDFWRLFMISFNFIQVLFNSETFIFISVTLIFSIIYGSKITHSYWFVIVFLLLKKGLNISNHCISDWFIYLFWFKKISCVVFRFFYVFLSCLIFFTSVQRFDMFWFATTDVCFKMAYSLVFNTIHYFYGLGNIVN